MPVSTAPSVIAALHTVLEPLSVPVHYGSPMENAGGDFVCVAWGEGGQAVTTDNEWAALGSRSQEERYGVACFIRVVDGDAAMSTAVATAYDLLSDCSELIAVDYSLGAACRIASVTDHAMTTDQNQHGAEVRITFTVTVEARI